MVSRDCGLTYFPPVGGVSHCGAGCVYSVQSGLYLLAIAVCAVCEAPIMWEGMSPSVLEVQAVVEVL